MKNNLFGKDLLTVEGLKKADIERLIVTAFEMEKLVRGKGGDRRLEGKIMAALFFEPSSRTFSSFISAMQRLGGGIIPLNGMGNTSAVKGESIEDTSIVFSSYADLLVIRHFDTGIPAIFAENTKVPVINAGDGAYGEHPSQALLDLFTINKNFGKIDGLSVTMVGDLAHYRGVNSLAKALCLFEGVSLNFVSPSELAIGTSLRKYLKNNNIRFREFAKLDEVLSETDVLNVTRLKKEYLDEELYNRLIGTYSLNTKSVMKMKKKSIIIHNLPRLWEIEKEVDQDPRAVYLKSQVQNGLYMRMAIIDSILRNNS